MAHVFLALARIYQSVTLFAFHLFGRMSLATSSVLCLICMCKCRWIRSDQKVDHTIVWQYVLQTMWANTISKSLRQYKMSQKLRTCSTCLMTRHIILWGNLPDWKTTSLEMTVWARHSAGWELTIHCLTESELIRSIDISYVSLMEFG